MNILNNLKTGVKLVGAFMVLAVITGIVGVCGMVYIQTITNEDAILYKNMTVPISQLAAMDTDFQRIRINIRDVILSNDAAESQKLILTKEMGDLFTSYSAARKTFDLDRGRIVTLATANKDSEAIALLRGDAYTNSMAVTDLLDKMTAMKVAQAKQSSDTNAADARQATIMMIIIMAAAILLAVVFGVVITRGIVVPLNIVVKISRSLAVGDLVRDMSEKEKDKVRLRKDEIGDVGKSFDGVIQYMQEMGKAAMSIAQNDLTPVLKSKSEKDELSQSFIKMIV